MIRAYRPNDLQDVLSVWLQASRIAHPFLSAAFLEEEERNLQEQFLPESQTWVAEIQGQVVAFLSLMGNEVGGLFVHPAWQHQGIGTALLDKAKSLHHVLQLEVFEANRQARAFYARSGFVPISRFRDEETDQMTIRLRFVKGM